MSPIGRRRLPGAVRRAAARLGEGPGPGLAGLGRVLLLLLPFSCQRAARIGAAEPGRGQPAMAPRAKEVPPPPPPPPPDLYRDTWVRYLGYANEVGESFRAIVPVSLVWASYGLATAYATADAVDKGKKAAATASQEEGRTTRATVAVVDTFMWQALASVVIPGYTINRVCAASLYLMGRTTRWPLSVRKWATTAVGLSAIPFIIKPIDRSVDFLMDSSLRKLYKTEDNPPPSF